MLLNLSAGGVSPGPIPASVQGSLSIANVRVGELQGVSHSQGCSIPRDFPFPGCHNSRDFPFPGMPHYHLVPFPGISLSQVVPLPEMSHSQIVPFPDCPIPRLSHFQRCPILRHVPFPGMSHSLLVPFPGIFLFSGCSTPRDVPFLDCHIPRDFPFPGRCRGPGGLQVLTQNFCLKTHELLGFHLSVSRIFPEKSFPKVVGGDGVVFQGCRG